MMILYVSLFFILGVCFPAAVGAVFRLIFKKPNARLITLLAAVLLYSVQYAWANKVGLRLDRPFMVDDMPLVSGLLCVVSESIAILFYYWIVSLGVELVDSIRKQKERLESGELLLSYPNPMHCNVGIIFLALSFVYIVGIFSSLLWMRLPVQAPLLSKSEIQLLMLMPESILFFLAGWVVSSAFLTTKRLRWVLVLAVMGSVMQGVFHRYDFPTSTSIWHRMGVVLPPVMTAWFVVVGYVTRLFYKKIAHHKN